MAKLATLSNLETLVTTMKSYFTAQSDFDSLKTTVEGIVATGGEANVIETVQVNGTALTVTDKTVNVTVPTAVSELTNDSGYATTTEVATAVSEAGHASITVVETLPDAADAESNVMYYLMNSETGYYDIYVLIDGALVLIDDTTVDLSGYLLASEIEEITSDEITALFED